MLKLIPFTAVALGLSSGVALADRHGGDHRAVGGDHRAVRGDDRAWEHRGVPQVVRDHRDGHGGAVVRGGGEWHGGAVVRDGRDWRGGSRVVVRGDRFRAPYYHNVVRRPIYVSRPIIRGRFFDYYRRPAFIVESYGSRPGYYWVAGQWYWSGDEWLWQPGHYQPDPNYIDPAYDSGYSDSY